jgi:hypothetical protein
MGETLDDGLLFDGYIQPPDVPPDPTGEDWRGLPGPPGPQGPVGPQGIPGIDTGIGEAPTDGKIYGRQGNTTAWVEVLPLTGGTVAGPVSVTRLNISSLPFAQPDGSPPVGALSGDIYNNGGFLCVKP